MNTRLSSKKSVSALILALAFFVPYAAFREQQKSEATLRGLQLGKSSSATASKNDAGTSRWDAFNVTSEAFQNANIDANETLDTENHKGFGRPPVPGLPEGDTSYGKPWFVLHVGPSKTATTTMQNDLRQVDTVLAADNYVYLGRPKGTAQQSSRLQSTLFNRKCLEPMYQARKSNRSVLEVPCWNYVVREIHDLWKTNTSIVLSSELMSNMGSPLWEEHLFRTLVKALRRVLADEWNAFVVVGFRRYAEWSLSSLKQLHGTGCANDRHPELWAPQRCPAPWPFMKAWMLEKPLMAKNFYYVDTVIQRWRKAFPVRILNYHAEGHITQKFVCDILPDASRTCEHLSNRTEPEQSSNVRTSTTGAFTSLATIAHQKGLLHPQAQRLEVVAKMQQYLQHQHGIEYRHLPLRDCPSRHELEQLLNISLRMERELLPDWYDSPYGEPVHRGTFWRIADEKKEFCDIDVSTALANKTSWQEVLQGLVEYGRVQQELLSKNSSSS